MKRLGKIFSLLSRDENGAVLVLVALIILVLLGTTALAVDAGALYQTRRQMVSAADAAALAGARELILNPSGVEEKAKHFANINGADVDIDGVDDQFLLSTTSDTVTVVAGKNVEYLFGRFLGLTDTVVSAEATAKVSPIYGLKGLIPIGIPPDDYEAGDIFDLVNVGNHETFGPGNWGYVDLDAHPGGGVPQLSERIRDGYDEEVFVGDEIKTETGNKTVPPAVESELQHHIDEGNVLFVPIVDVYTDTQNGVDDITVIGFAAVILTEVGYYGPGKNNMYVKGEFQYFVTSGEAHSDASDYGLYVVKLIK